MKIIPNQYQEVEILYQTVINNEARCITLVSSTDKEGTSTIAISLAQRLQINQHSVLLIDLNKLSPITELDFVSECEQQNAWCFSDISCQLNVRQWVNFNFLSIKKLKNEQLVREKSIFKEAVIRLLQEFDYILFDMSPTTQNNQSNFPLHLLAEISELTLVNVALGKCREVDLHHTIKKLNQAGVHKIEIIASQHYLPALGPVLIQLFEKKLNYAPKLRKFVVNLINKNAWLFQVY